MPDDAGVPLDSPTEPGITRCQIAEAYHIIGVQKVFLPPLIPKFPQPSSVFRKKNRPETVVFQNSSLHPSFFQFAAICLVLAVRISVLSGSICFKYLILLIQVKFQIILKDRASCYIRHAVFLPQAACPHSLCLKSQFWLHTVPFPSSVSIWIACLNASDLAICIFSQ